MFHFSRKGLVHLVLAFILLAGMFIPAVSASANGGETISYLSIGDSLAAGMTPEKGLDSSFSDFTAEVLKENGVLKNYSKAFAVSGYKTDDILKDLQSKPELTEAIKQSNVISISAGANDLLSKVKREGNALKFDQIEMFVALQMMGKNYSSILESIKQINPDATVYVMGYYFPYPHISADQKPQLMLLTKTLNQTIETLATAQGATFVPVYDAFGEDSKQYVPNPENIHPNLEGYKKMSHVLLEYMNKPKPVPVAKDTKGSFAEAELNALISKNLLKLDSKGNVYPESAITRAEVAEVMYGSFPFTQSMPADPGFKDVPTSHPSYLAIAKLTEAGVFVKSESFKPDSALTRAQMAKIFTLMFKLKPAGAAGVYKDVPANFWGKEYIDALTTNKIMTGYANGYIGVNDAAKKSQFAMMLARTQKLLNSH